MSSRKLFFFNRMRTKSFFAPWRTQHRFSVDDPCLQDFNWTEHIGDRDSIYMNRLYELLEGSVSLFIKHEMDFFLFNLIIKFFV